MKEAAFNQEGIKRVDGHLKVTGSVKYAAENPFHGLVYGALVHSTIAKGTIKAIDSKAAMAAPGVVAVISHLDAPKIPGYAGGENGGEGEIRVFATDKIFFNGQPIVLVVADSFERAKHAASLVKIQYQKEQHQTSLD